MTQEEKNLLLKDLCGRLPYNIKVYDKNGNFNTSYVNLLHINGKVSEAFVGNGMQCRTAPIDEIKPYLFPMSSMTEEQKKEWRSLMRCDLYGILYPTIKSFDYLYKNHIDVRGLISLGLAIDATGLNIY